MTSLFALDPRWPSGSPAAWLSVSQLTQHLSSLVREDAILQDVWIRGEVSNLTQASSGHLYFSLKDESACLHCVMWRSDAGRLEFRPESGMQALAHGSVDVYPPRGQYQLVVDELQPDGAGALYLALEQVKARLFGEGLLDDSRKRPLPVFPQTVAVVTSLSGAAVRDICVILRQETIPARIVLVPARVQGVGAVESLCGGLSLANERSGADLVILGRGGGSLEDLWSFNSEALARAIAASRVPVISAVGHETDFTLADLTADLRAPTPTAAAEMVVARRAEFLRRLDAAAVQAQSLFRSRVQAARLRVNGLARRSPLARPQWMVETRRQRLDDLNSRLLRVGTFCLERWRHRLALAAGKLEGVSPLATLARGYAAVTRLPEETAVTRVAQVNQEDLVRVRLVDGALVSRVISIQSSGGRHE